MAVNKKREALRRQLSECADAIGKNNAAGKTGKDFCDGLIAMNHYFHILLLLDDPELDKTLMYAYLGMAEETIAKIKNKERKRRALLGMALLSKHTAAWNMAHFHYERAVKSLCMMMVTLMDYIIQAQGGASLLYPATGDGAEKYQDLRGEIAALNEDYRTAYFSVGAFDFCTKKLGDYLAIPFYEDIACEHDRIIRNGNPQRVTAIMNRLSAMAGEPMRAVEMAYTPEPPYDEALFEKCYRQAVMQYKTEEAAMEAFSGMVQQVSRLYQAGIGKQERK